MIPGVYILIVVLASCSSLKCSSSIAPTMFAVEFADGRACDNAVTAIKKGRPESAARDFLICVPKGEK